MLPLLHHAGYRTIAPYLRGYGASEFRDPLTTEEFAAAKKSWKGKDFEDVVLHSYRSQWGHAELDPKYEKQQAQFESTRTLTAPTLLIHGPQDYCELAETTTLV